MVLRFKASPGATCACVLFRGDEFVLHWLYHLFIPLNWEPEKAVMGLPELGGTSWCSECSPIWQGKVSCLSSLTCHLAHSHPLVTASGPDYLLPPLQRRGSLHAVRDTIWGHHLGTPSRGHSRPKLTLTLQHLLTWICWTVRLSSQHVTCSLPGDCKKAWGGGKTYDSDRIQQHYSLEIKVIKTMYWVQWKCRLVVLKQITLQEQH